MNDDDDDAIDGILRTQKFFVTKSFDLHSHVEKRKRKERRSENDREERKLEKNNNNNIFFFFFFECLSRTSCAIRSFTSLRHRRAMQHFEPH